MNLQLCTKSPAHAETYGNSPGEKNTNSPYRGDRDKQTYGVTSVAGSEDVGKVRKSTKVTLSRSVIILVVSILILSAVINIISGVFVYHLTNGKITKTSRQMTPETTTSDGINRQIDTLNRAVQAMQDNRSSADNVMHVLKEIIQQLQNRDTTADHQVVFAVQSPTVSRARRSPSRFVSNAVLKDGLWFKQKAINTFTCTTAGWHTFAARVSHMSGGGEKPMCDIRKNNETVSAVTSVLGDYSSGSSMELLKLSVGDKMNLDCSNLKSAGTGTYRIAFTGRLLYEG